MLFTSVLRSNTWPSIFALAMCQYVYVTGILVFFSLKPLFFCMTHKTSKQCMPLQWNKRYHTRQILLHCPQTIPKTYSYSVRHHVEINNIPFKQNKTNHSPVYPIDYAMALYELGTTLQDHRDVVAGIQQMLPEIAAENALLQDTRLLQSTSGRTIQNKTSKKRNQLAVFP